MKRIIFDLETLPDLPAAMKEWCGLGNWPGRTLKASITSIICAGWKEVGSEETHCINAWDFPNWQNNKNDDSEVCKAIYEVLADADQVITHNGKKFDWKHLQTRLGKNGINYLPKIPHVDTCRIQARELYLFSNSLKHSTEFHGCSERKMDHGEGWQLWVDVYNDCPIAKQLMTDYCKQDVRALEQLYMKLRPLIEPAAIPNMNLFQVGQGKKDCCPLCGSTQLTNKGYRNTQTRTYKRYVCRNCGKYSRTDGADRNPRAY